MFKFSFAADVDIVRFSSRLAEENAHSEAIAVKNPVELFMLKMMRS